ncbi:MAG: SUMF1/EgtB/PvdO family nonheme iron enzyme [Bacteroidia bacterium]|nr:SUMF1/EgtB/PvdO family nonheme iron enzyme [Bacteroidia bacterium]
MLTGKVPLNATDRASGFELPTPISLRPDMNPSLSQAIMKGLSFRYQKRYQTVMEFWDELPANKHYQNPFPAVGSELPTIIQVKPSFHFPEPEMIPVRGGEFIMGETVKWYQLGADNPAHTVRVDNFLIGKYPVTQNLWEAVMGNNPSHFKGKDLPVERVSWDDVQLFIQKLNQLTGKSYRLPTEAEWEYAARGGNKKDVTKYSGSDNIENVAWYGSNSGGKTHPVGQKSPNGLGIYDMSGNVWEWCSDWYSSYSSGSQTNPTGASSGSYRVNRGGSWYSDARFSRTSYRGNNSPTIRFYNIGFRLSRTE